MIHFPHICHYCHRIVWPWQNITWNPLWNIYNVYDYFHRPECWKKWLDEYGTKGSE